MSTFQRTLPNALTFTRILIIPVMIWSFYVEGGQLIAAGLFLLASITDFFDGLLARRWRVESKLGTFLDPIADKLLVLVIIIMLIHFDRLGTIDLFAAIIILCREIFVSGLREFLGQLNVSVPVSKLAKWKTAFQMIALFLLILTEEKPVEDITNIIGGFFLWAAAILTCVTGYAYLKAGLKYMEQ